VIFLTGFMGSGKTTVGEDLAHRTGAPFVDLDEVIARKSGTSIADIFRCAGEEAFRALEDTALKETAAQGGPSCIVATGGGLPVSPLNRKLMKSCGSIVYLKSSFENLELRIAQDGSRPLWNSGARDLLKKRIPAYEDADLAVDIDGRTAQDIAHEIVKALPGLPRPVGVILPDRPYPIHIGSGVFRKIIPLLERHTRPEGLFVMIDENVLRIHGDAVKEAIRGYRTHFMAVTAGERSKSMAFLNDALDAMFSCRVSRQWVCLAIGGGVTGDLAGFAASIYMRGIPVIQAATTLLAQIDSGIGGKTAVNHACGKNLIGTFHQPLMVVCDIDFLATLDDTEIMSAMAEAVKYGIITDAPLFEYLEAGPPFDYERIVRMCASVKARVVARDEKEEGLRRILNFGHTLGHAIERSTGYSVSHGQAVAVGMAFASWLSHDRGMLPPADLRRIMDLMMRERLLPKNLALPPAAELEQALGIDKKGGKGGVHFVLTPYIGGVSVQKLTEIEVLEAYQRFADGYQKSI